MVRVPFVDDIVSGEVVEELEEHVGGLEGVDDLQDVLIDVLEGVEEEKGDVEFACLFGDMEVVVDDFFFLLFEAQRQRHDAGVAGLVVLGEEGVEVTLDGG